MSISRVTTWSSGQVLTASALNGEFNNVLNNALSLISPLTGALNANGNDITSLDELTFSDATANPTTSGGLRRNGNALVWLLSGSHTNSVLNLAHLIANTSGTPAAGIGTGLLFSSESGDEDPCNVGALQFALSDVGAGTEDSYADIQTRVAGAALASTYRFQATGANRAVFTHANSAARTYTLPDADTTIGTASGIPLFLPTNAILPATNFPALTKNAGTNWVDYTLDFDKATDEAAYWQVLIPSGTSFTTATLDVYFKMATVTSGAVIWQATTITRAEGEAWDTAGTTDSFSAETVQGTAGMVSLVSKALTVTGWAAGEVLMLKLNRDADAGGDTADEDAKFMGAVLRLA